MDSITPVDTGYEGVIHNICSLDWASLGQDDMTKAAWAYYYFSVQFRENLEIAHRMHPDDPKLNELLAGECHTDNLSPWPGVMVEGEKANHDEFMRRSLQLTPVDPATKASVEAIGVEYLAKMRAQSDLARAMSIASFEDGGLERVFSAMLSCQSWDTPLLAAFRHFLIKHIEFDGDPAGGHGALARHLHPDERIRPLWDGFYQLFVNSVPRLKD